MAKFGEATDVMTGGPDEGIRPRHGLRITLLTLAVTILLLGATVACAFGYHLVASG
ncbi:MAG TPA: hypothetical protein VMU95_30280 [Trebonia sp.]|nr:hypothetical protein [Trebonia sp.]